MFGNKTTTTISFKIYFILIVFLNFKAYNSMVFPQSVTTLLTVLEGYHFKY
jgi:hypothetical protein